MDSNDSPDEARSAFHPDTVGSTLTGGASASVGAGQIGPYRLLRVLGEGGMGEVWLAEQTAPVRRSVALKLIKAGMDTTAGGRALRGRAPGAGADGPPEHRQGVRRRRDAGGPAVLRDGVRAGACRSPSTATSTGLTMQERLRVVHAGLRGRAARASEGDHPPRPEAIEHAGGGAERQADAQDHRLRRRQGDGAAADRRTRSVTELGAADRHAGVHEPRAGGAATRSTSTRAPTCTRSA